jgi:hypothetical protein
MIPARVTGRVRISANANATVTVVVNGSPIAKSTTARTCTPTQLVEVTDNRQGTIGRSGSVVRLRARFVFGALAHPTRVLLLGNR